MKAFDNKLKTMVKNLPVQGPTDELWTKISSQLDFNDKLILRSRELPLHDPKKNTWGNIEKGLPSQKRKGTNRIIIITLYAAASVAFLIGIWVSFGTKKQGTISVSEETISNWQEPFKITNDTVSTTINGFINEQCSSKSYICNQPEFSEKKQQLDDVEIQIKNIEQVISASGNSSSLIKTRIKLENLKARLMKDLINMITS